mmetsp:Transcript_14177/g.27144  ORF Transcript_14177/g.27144 Transcript_14177/m.27144 type:complete len:242 (-) Transcript_14177:718-1443(-)
MIESIDWFFRMNLKWKEEPFTTEMILDGRLSTRMIIPIRPCIFTAMTMSIPPMVYSTLRQKTESMPTRPLTKTRSNSMSTKNMPKRAWYKVGTSFVLSVVLSNFRPNYRGTRGWVGSGRPCGCWGIWLVPRMWDRRISCGPFRTTNVTPNTGVVKRLVPVIELIITIYNPIVDVGHRKSTSLKPCKENPGIYPIPLFNDRTNPRLCKLHQGLILNDPCSVTDLIRDIGTGTWSTATRLPSI